MIAATLQALERFLLPNVCVSCDRPVERTRPEALICGVCRSRFRTVAGGCGRCGQPLPPVGPCRFCASWAKCFTWARSAVWLDVEAREVTHHLKYGGYTLLADALVPFIARTVRRPVSTWLVPVPLNPRRQRRRGYNQAAALAHALARFWRLPVREDLLHRTRDTRSQTTLTLEKRLENVAGVFAARPPPRSRRDEWQTIRAVGGREGGRAEAPPAAAAGMDPCGIPRGQGLGVVLVDDVLTTGATLAAAAEALGEAGWRDVGAVTFARALPFAARAQS